MLNLFLVESGQVIRLKNRTTAEVVENVGDGIGLNARFPAGEEELVFCEDIAGISAPEAR